MIGNVIGYRESIDRNSREVFGYYVYLGENISSHGLGISSRGCFVSSYVLNRYAGGDINNIYHKDVSIGTRQNDKGSHIATDISIIQQ